MGGAAIRAWAMAALLLGAPFVAGLPAPEGASSPPPDVRARLPTGIAIANVGQVRNPDVRYYATSGSVGFGFADGAVLLRVDGPRGAGAALVRTVFEGAERVRPEGREPASPPARFVLGRDGSGWQADAPSYAEVVYDGIYGGIDLAYRFERAGVKYEFRLDAGVDPARIAMRYEGAEGLRLDGRGLVLRTAGGEVRDTAPIAWQENRAVACAFALRGPATVGFECRGRDPSRPLVIDPLVYATFLGGSGSDRGRAVAVDAAGNLYVAGTTASPDFPATPGSLDPTPNGASDVFVAKLAPSGTRLLFATYVGGGSDEEILSIAVDAAGNVFGAGYTLSADFPTTPAAHDRTFDSGDAFVLKLDSDGTLVYATLLGGSGLDEALGIALSPLGEAYVVGETLSSNFPVTSGAFDRVGSGGWDAFAAKLDASGSGLVYSTFLGGSFFEVAHAVAVDAAGRAYVTGFTLSTDFPITPGALQTRQAGASDAFVVILDPDGARVEYATYLGAIGAEDARGIALDADGAPVIVGETSSPRFPTTRDAFDGSFNGLTDAFVAKIALAGDALVYSTFLGGSGFDEARSVAVDGSGGAYVAGVTDSVDFPLTSDAVDTSLGAPEDAFVARLDRGGRLVYATYIGGASADGAHGIAVDSGGNAVVTGETAGRGFPTTSDAVGGGPGGEADAFLVIVSPTGARSTELFVAVAVFLAVAALLVFLLVVRWRRRRETRPPPPPAA